MRVVVAGCGDLGTRLARRLAASGHQVLAIRRTPQPDEAGIEWRALDVLALAPAALCDWRPDVAVCAAGPGERSAAAYARCYGDLPLALFAATGALRRLIVVMSSALLGDHPGRVDEDHPAAPADWRGAAMGEAETRLRMHCASLVLACPSGLYGPGRDSALRRARAGERGQRRWTHRIHIDDAAAAVAHLLALSEARPRYLLSDDLPVAEDEFLDGLRGLLRLPTSGIDDVAAVTGRRLDNGRLRASGFVLAHPDFRHGYAALLRDHERLAV